MSEEGEGKRRYRALRIPGSRLSEYYRYFDRQLIKRIKKNGKKTFCEF